MSLKDQIRAVAKSIIGLFIPDIYLLDYVKEQANGKRIKSDISSTVKLNPPYYILESNIGKYTYLSQNAKINYTCIGNFCSVGPNLMCGWGIHPTSGISTSPMFYSIQKQNGITLCNENKIEERKPIIIGNDVFIGMNVTILDGVTVGDGAVIGAGCIVSKNVPSYAIVIGNPMKILRYRFKEEYIRKLLQIKWWEFDGTRLQDVEKNFFEVEKFINKYYSCSTNESSFNLYSNTDL